MARRKIKFEKGNYYHIYNRGALKSRMFVETDNYIFLLKQFHKYSQKLYINIIAYCLMPNHYHLLLQQIGKKAVAIFIQRVLNSYSKAFNKRYERSGTLFEGPYKAIHVDDESYLIHLCRYIHRNPLEAELTNHIEEWPFSILKEWLNLRNGSLFDENFRNLYFNSPSEYSEFLENVAPPNELEEYLF